MAWECLPYTVCYEIFQYFDHKEVVTLGSVCRNWFEVSRDERLWKKLFFSQYPIDRDINNRGLSWYQEFRRLHYNVPVIQTEVIREHYDQVLHITFSHNGRYFVTCSRDCFVMIWTSSYPAKLKDSLDMTVFNWRCAHYSEFNESDSLLLVSGIVMGPETSTVGEIIVFHVEDFLSTEPGLLKMKCRIDNTPYSLFGTWFNDSFLLSGNRFWLGGFVTSSLIYINRASQETSSELIPVTHGLFKFYNTNRSTITSLLVAKCLRDIVLDNIESDKNESHIDRSSFKINQFQDENFDEHLLYYNIRYREYEKNVLRYDDDFEMKSEDGDVVDDLSTSGTSSSSDSATDSDDKYLIFVTGSNTYIPHEIGIKRIKSFKFPDRIDPGPSLKERQMLLDERKRLLDSGVDNIYWNDIDSIAEKFDSPDYLIDLHGHILGMRLSPDHRFLFVTIRRWPEWETYNFNDVVDPLPKVQSVISLNVIDMMTLEIVGVSAENKSPYSVEADYYFVYMDVTEEYIVSTGEGPNLHLWDRHYGIHLANLKHKDITNGAAFNPKDPEMMVSVSDDGVIKVWRSLSKIRELKIRPKSEEDDTDDSWTDDQESEASS
ncbi:F-box/WD repeat-containing protein 5 [Coccinella septempunctata]|uniref:F-box/WD repeat-containing protein 5 n=1 Tax=Coccinella septempunctata TaxID=41139 RepID=UPI001D0756B5|nr:F-box/WD repeat-containing protein 5 [Coccinella septempunctata]